MCNLHAVFVGINEWITLLQRQVGLTHFYLSQPLVLGKGVAVKFRKIVVSNDTRLTSAIEGVFLFLFTSLPVYDKHTVSESESDTLLHSVIEFGPTASEGMLMCLFCCYILL